VIALRSAGTCPNRLRRGPLIGAVRPWLLRAEDIRNSAAFGRSSWMACAGEQNKSNM
jgi:hypothetical protein